MADRVAPTTVHTEDRNRRPVVDPSWFFRRWVGLVALGRVLGSRSPREPAWLLQPSISGPVQTLVMLLAAGAIEGALLGVAQVLALRALPLRRSLLRRWPVLTSLAAVVAWLIGLLPSTLPG